MGAEGETLSSGSPLERPHTLQYEQEIGRGVGWVRERVIVVTLSSSVRANGLEKFDHVKMVASWRMSCLSESVGVHSVAEQAMKQYRQMAVVIIDFKTIKTVGSPVS